MFGVLSGVRNLDLWEKYSGAWSGFGLRCDMGSQN